MTQEEKAKAYDRVLSQAQDIYHQSNAEGKLALECIFPELAENEDKRIRKNLIEKC